MGNKIHAEVLSELGSALAPERVLTAEADRWSYSYDASFGVYPPECVVQPISTEEVVALVRIACKHNIPLYPRGAGSCLSGGPLPVYGGIAVDLTHLNQTLEIFADDLVAVVSPGVKTGDIQKAAERYGLFYPPDPSSSGISTIGGNIAENSGGPRGLKYGVTRDYVLGLEVVTPEGSVLRTGGRTVKNVTGYDLTRLIIGSEGTLGIVTKAVLRLLPKPQARRTMLAVFSDLVQSGRAISKVLTSGILPCAIEIIDQACLRAVEAFRPGGLPIDAEAVLLVEVDGHPAAVEEEILQVAEICRQLGSVHVEIAKDEQTRERLWFARKQISPAIARIKPTKISEDATVPRSQIPAMFARLKQIREKYAIDLVVFGHAGDGNLHPNILCDMRNQEEMQRVEQAVSEIFQAALELGGTLSGEHGIGTMKAPFLSWEVGEVGIDMMKRIKTAWDPLSIMNPGKIFPEPGNDRLVLRQ
ncbi:FAD-binding protein [Fodinisporobacter ferrooxydans]|uniref:FAD-binding protein n=1 Tax=Fodinisporobacter ferrooxydans TaxID=2901836 RepID=A0ABY4CNG6_9BACL|nr:FAD-binding protein [Alicyclobacillaceae bacterium MYW30-H2]